LSTTGFKRWHIVFVNAVAVCAMLSALYLGDNGNYVSMAGGLAVSIYAGISGMLMAIERQLEQHVEQLINAKLRAPDNGSGKGVGNAL
jgi:hypothetical protein